MRHRLLPLLFSVALLTLAPIALAAPSAAKPPKPSTSATTPAPTPSAAPSADAEDEPSGDPELAKLDWQPGPKAIDLGHDLSMALPEAHLFLGGKDAAKVLEKMGNFHNDNLLGIVVDKSGVGEWIVTIRYDDEGYVKDDESIDANELLKSIREGTEEANSERVAHGFAPLHIDGWSDPPRYDRSSHRLIWALIVSSEHGKSINYNTRILGRRGIVSLNLVDAPESIEGAKPQVAVLLAGTAYATGARYEDFNSKTDKVAAFGLTGLILGAAGLGALKLAKVGFIAAFWKSILAFLLAAKKAIVLAFAAAAAFMKRLFGKKPKSRVAPSAPTNDEPPPAA